MSKKYVGKTCVYCTQPGASQGGDHVICREFFLQTRRMDLPVVPACRACNNAKSKLEHYLASVMPFGGAHRDAGETLATSVPRRLARNRALATELSQGLVPHLATRNGGPWQIEGTVPLDGARLVKLLEYITRGLAYWHWGLYLPEAACLIRAAFVNPAGEAFFESLLAMNAKHREVGNLGDGVFIYECMQAAECNELTVWRMSLYGAEVGGDSRAPRSTSAYAITVPKGTPTAAEIASLLGGA